MTGSFLIEAFILIKMQAGIVLITIIFGDLI